MKFAPLLKHFLLLTAMLVLAACGGGGDSGSDSVFDPPGIRMTATATASSVNSGQYVDVTVRVTQANGTDIANGTVVRSVISPASMGALQYMANGVAGGSSGGTVGGLATFRFTAAQTAGTAALTFSADQGGRSVSTSVNVTVNALDNRLQITATRTTMPVNQFDVLPFFGSPYMSEVTVTVKDGSGQPVNMPDGIQVSVNPVGAGSYSTLDDPETDCKLDEEPPSLDGCEFLIRMGQGPVDVVAGKATLFFHSSSATGTTTMTVTTQDSVSGATITTSLDFHIVETLPPLPTLLTLEQTGPTMYVQGSGGNTASSLRIGVYDGIGQTVPDPVSGNQAYNNYMLEIVGDASTVRETLRGINATGQTVSGKSVALRTTAGIGGALLTSGDRTGTVVLRVTADSADNNVDNGIQQAVTVERSVVISDGRLWDIELVNPAASAVEVDGMPVSANSAYSLTVAAIATDRLGNPVLPGTTIKFGLIDEPQATGTGDFRFQGGDGDPQEGGKLFTSASGTFLGLPGVDDAVGAGDGLVVFGEHVPGNRDLESARVVGQVNSNTSLSVTYRFNHNDDSGTTVNDGPVLPYIIGRAADGNIVASGTTDANGVVRTKLNYPVSKLGKTVVVWAQGDGKVVNGNPETVTDVEFATFAGARDLHVTANPGLLWANGTDTVELCVTDFMGMPVGGTVIKFAFDNLIGIGSVDGTQLQGSVGSSTAFGTGCTTVTVTTGSITDAVLLPTLRFYVDGNDGEAKVEFEVAGSTPELALIAYPTHYRHTGNGILAKNITLTLLDASGAPIPGSQIIGTCTGSDGVSINLLPNTPGVTNANGVTIASVTVENLTQAGSAGTAACVFQTIDGNASTEVTFEGIDICEVPTSPIPPECVDIANPEQYDLEVTLVTGAVAGNYRVFSDPPEFSCQYQTVNSTFTCPTGHFWEGTEVRLTTTGPSGAVFAGWSGDCHSPVGEPRVAIAQMGGNRSCTATGQQ